MFSLNQSRKKIFYTGVLFLALSGCATDSKNPAFDPKTCLEQVPESVPDLQILQGPRSEQSIILDMQTSYCNGQVLLKLMHEKGHQMKPGNVTFKVVVEYTGEVISAKVIESEIRSKEFLGKVSDMIMDSDFAPWQRHDEDTEFIFPMTFNVWWQESKKGQ